jgi:aspartyl-tRNA(Asn)/glutamyl-tRNA(Gln) amidotransferase subunit A
VDAILAGAPPVVPAPRALAGARLAIAETLVLNDMDAAVAAAFERACTLLQAAGAQLRRLAVPEFAELGRLHARGTLASAEAWAWHRGLLSERAVQYDPRVGLRLRGGEAMGAADYIDLLAARRRWVAQVEARLDGVDALLMPTVPIVAPRIEALAASDEAYFAANGLVLRNPTLINFLDGCALSLPCHRPDEAPVGLMLAAPRGHDHTLLALGLGVEQVLRDVTAAQA